MTDESGAGAGNANEAGAGEGGNGGAGDGGGEAFEAITSQEDFDKRLGERITRERAKFADYDAIKTELEGLKDSSKTDVDRAVEAARAEALSEASAASDKRLIRAEIKAAAGSVGFHDPGDALAAYGDVGDLSVGEDGEVDVEVIKARLAEIAESKPYLVAEAAPTARRRTPPKARTGDKTADEGRTGKSKAAAALRQLRAQ